MARVKLILAILAIVATLTTLIPWGLEKMTDRSRRTRLSAAFEAAEEQQWKKAYELLHDIMNELTEDRKIQRIYIEAAYQTGNIEDCERVVDWILSLSPEDQWARGWKKLLEGSKQPIRIAEKWLEDSEDWLLRRLEAFTAATASKWMEAYALLCDHISNHHDDREAHLLFIEAAYETDHLDEAHAAINRLLQEAPRDAEATYWKGVLYLADGEASRAIDYLTSSLARLRDRVPEIYMYLGIAYLEDRRKVEGCEAFRRYMDLGSDVAWLRETRKSMGKYCES